MTALVHRSVMVDEIIQALQPNLGGLIMDGTVGGGGHSEALLEAHPSVRVIGLDRDAEAIETAARRLARFGDRFQAFHLDYREAPEFLAARGVVSLDGALLDLGLSSGQVDDPARGFSFQLEGPLDMRMDRRQMVTARQLVNELTEKELSDLIFRYGEEPAARRIARQIVRAREEQPIETTRALAAIVARASRPFSRQRIHPATRTFQAIRIAVNHELDGLCELIKALIPMIAPGRRLAVIAFHSMEDRIVKQSFRWADGECQCRVGLFDLQPADRCPVCGAGRRVKILTRRPILPSSGEVERNPRSRSAKLRVCERMATGE
ncbi:MAG: 16S rRNA (cytosine(1402)-N(4))-methyltransferase RsmH [Acidobacteria bacterium]|nr:16S rRNA (cytosine(1402)-N(4))-methyltransferase RsmH [Acidobacteriota bacterium]